MVTLAEIAAKAGVSRSAVSKALLGGGGKTTKVSAVTMERIRGVAKELGYHPNLLAQQLAGGRQRIIGLIVDSQCCGMYSTVMGHIERLIAQAGYRLQVGLVHDSYEVISDYVNDLLGYNIQSVICMAHYYPFAERVPPLFSRFRNVVFMSKPMTEEPFSFVSPDYYASFFEAMEHLLRQGHRRIVFAKSSYDTFDARVRAQAFRDAHREAGVAFAEEQIYSKPVGEINTREQMDAFLTEVLPMRPDALILGSGVACNWCVRCLRERGLRVPEDISLMALEDWPGSHAVTPSLSYIDNDNHAIAQKIVDIVLRNMDTSKQEPEQVFIPGHFCLGESIADK